MEAGAQRVSFAGRVNEAEAYAAFVRRYAHALDDGIAAEHGRRNVLVFHGAGGKGKSQLLVRLRRWTDGEAAPDGWGPNPLGGRRHVTLNYDLADRGLDADLLFERLRAIARDEQLRTPAFDIGLLARWSLTRPIDPAPDLSPSRPHVGPIDLWTAVEGVAKGALAALGLTFGTGALTVDAIKTTIGTLRASAAKKRTVAACPHLAPALEQLLDDDNAFGASSLAPLLDWDLDRVPIESRPYWVVFLDTYERIRGDTRFQERALNRIVCGTPRLCWVIAGRHPVGWAEAGGALLFTGADRWPELAADAGAPDQHALEDLSPDEVRRLAEAALPDGEGAEAIVAAAAGWPIAVGLALGRAEALRAAGRPVDAAGVGRSFEGILSNVTDGLSAPSRQGLNAGALVRAFDEELIRAGTGLSAGDAARFAREPLVTSSNRPLLPLSLHEVLRRAVRDAEIDLSGAWIEEEWRQAGEAMIAALQQRYKEERDDERRVALIGAAFDVAAEVGLEVRWLPAAARRVANKDRLIAAIEGRLPARPVADWSRAFERFVTAWAPHDPAERAERFGAVAADFPALDRLARTARRRQAYALRTAARHEEAETIFAKLRAQRDGPLLRYQHGLTLIHLGRFADAREPLERLLDGDPSDGDRTAAQRLEGEIRLHHGDLAPAIAAIAARAAYFESKDDAWNALELRTAEARARALLEGRDALAFVEQVIDRADRDGVPTLLRAAVCSKAMCLVGSEPVDDVIEDALELGRSSGAPEPTYHEAVAWAFDAAVRRDREAMRRAAERAAGSSRARDLRWSRPIAWWQARLLDEPYPRNPEVQWGVEGVDQVIQRWTALVEARA